MICKDMLEALGLPVLTAVDGRDAVDRFARHADAISRVILDLSMPNMDGMAAFTEIARIKPGVKVILSSGYDEQELVRRLSNRGLAGFIQKPYSLDDLRNALEGARASGPPGAPRRWSAGGSGEEHVDRDPGRPERGRSSVTGVAPRRAPRASLGREPARPPDAVGLQVML